MNFVSGNNLLGWAWPLRLEYMSEWAAAILFAVLGGLIVWMGMRALGGLGPVRKWVAIGVRLAVLGVFVLIVGGVRWQREHKNVEVMAIRDFSDSTSYVKEYPGKTLRASLDDYLMKASGAKAKNPEDRIGVINFTNQALIEMLPGTKLELGGHSIRENGNGTDAASAIQLALATLRNDAMHRLLLIWDGNQTAGNLDAAVSAAVAQHVPIDVMPLRYNVQNAVMMERFAAPVWKRENEPFTLDVILKSTSAKSVRGKLTVRHQGKPIDLDPYTAGIQPTREVTLQPGLNVERVKVPALEGGVHQFKATFEADAKAGVEEAQVVSGGMEAFTFVQGRGKVLYVDNVAEGRGEVLRKALESEGVNLEVVGVDSVPGDLMTLQNYDAVILANVPHGVGGVNEVQDKLLASYVHDTGGGLVMIGGPETFGAGGWQGSELEKVLPVNMDVPARKEVSKGALVLLMHSCEMPDGNYWGEQCALKAVEALSEQDEIGVVSYGWKGGGGSQWDYPLEAKGNGVKVKAAIKSMQLGDMPSFDDAMDLALNGRGGTRGLKDSDARQKHVIIVSDGDPQGPNAQLASQYLQYKVSVSTVTVYPHMGGPGGLPPVMKGIADGLKGRAYGPINSNPNQLPQIFIKEATVVRRSLISEDSRGIKLKLRPTLSEMVKGLGTSLEPVYGLVLTSVKPDPQIEMPIIAGKNNDPLLAHWQSGLGKVAVFTSDAHNRWATNWVNGGSFEKFWSQVVRGVARPPMSRDFDVQTRVNGEKGAIRVEAMDKDSQHLNFLNIRGQVVGPDLKAHEVRLVQTGPGTYKAEFETPLAGSYAVRLSYQGTKGENGWLVSGVAMNSTPELRDLRSNESTLREIARKTGGRELEPFDAEGADLFSREGLLVTASPMPIWDWMIPILLGLILVDVAVRRIAWDWKTIKGAVVTKVQEYTLPPKVKSQGAIDALKRVKEVKVVEATRPDPKAKFEAKGVEGDITKVVGGAEDKPLTPAPKKAEPKRTAESGEHMGSLLEAKRRAREAMKKKEDEG